MPAASRWFQVTSSQNQHNSQGRGSWPREGNHSTQTDAAGHSTAQICHLNTMVEKDGQKVGKNALSQIRQHLDS